MPQAEDDRDRRWRRTGAPGDTRGDDRHLAQGEGGSGDWEASAYGSGQRRGPGCGDEPYRPDPAFSPANWPGTVPPQQRFGTPGQAPGDGYGGWGAAGWMQERWSPAPDRGRGGGPATRHGPRRRRRSDADLHDEVCVRLSRDERLDTADVSVAVRHGHVTLEGTVVDRPMKHAIEDLVDRVHGVADIDNRIKVMRGADPRAERDAPPAPHPSVPQDSPTARDARLGRYSESMPGGSGKNG